MTAEDLVAAFEHLPAQWSDALPGWTKQRRCDVVRRVREVSAEREIAPADPFRALRLTDPETVRVVVLGQDPYPLPGHADGLAFSAGHGKPASLRRVFQVLREDRPGWTPPPVWKLDGWAHQGVLLLNPTLTIEVGRIASHLDCGWQSLTAEVVELLCRRERAPVFMLWGGKAQAFFAAARPAGCSPKCLVTRHPSNDFARQFMAEGRHFLETSDLIDWWAL